MTFGSGSLTSIGSFSLILTTPYFPTFIYGRGGRYAAPFPLMVESTLTGFPVPHAYPRPDLGRSGVAATQPWCQLSAPREPSTLPEIFVRSLISNNPYVPNGDEVDLNVVLDLRLYVEVVLVSPQPSHPL